MTTVNAGQKLRPSDLNVPGAIAVRNATLALAHNAATAVTFPTEEFDSDTMFAAGSDTITIKTAAVFQISGWVSIAANAVGIRVIEILRNGSIVLSDGINAAAAGSSRLTLGNAFLCAVNDTIKLQAFQNSGGALNIEAARLSVVRATKS